MKIKRCDSCGAYTMKDLCPKCGSRTKSPHPPKFSPEDKYGKYRRLGRARAESEKSK